MIPILLVLGVVALALSKRAPPVPPKPISDPQAVLSEAERIVREAQEIVDGKRDSFSE